MKVAGRHEPWQFSFDGGDIGFQDRFYNELIETFRIERESVLCTPDLWTVSSVFSTSRVWFVPAIRDGRYERRAQHLPPSALPQYECERLTGRGAPVGKRHRVRPR